MYKIIEEGKAKIKVPISNKVSKELPVFYNPDMASNRDISIALLNSVANKKMQIALPLAGSGVRGVRQFLELKKGKIESISFNDYSKEALKLIKHNIKLNKIKSKYYLSNKDANLFLLESTGFDYIDIDPFGSPNFLLNSSCVRMSRGGILGITATDTGALAGTFRKACVRKYWAQPMRNELMHEIALRILIRKCQLVSAQFDKALTPIYSHATLHYDRVYFKVDKGKQKVDELLKGHKYFIYCNKCMDRKTSTFNNEKCVCGEKMVYAGPLWIGQLADSKIASKIFKNLDNKLTKVLSEESKIDVVGFYDIHAVCSKYKLPVPKMDDLMNSIKKKYNCTKTHFSSYGIKSDIPVKELIKKIKRKS